MGMQQARRLAELVLYGTGDQRRFVQDGAIFFEVWLSLVQANGDAAAVLLQPYLDLPPAGLAKALRSVGITPGDNRLVYNNTLVSLFVTVKTLVCVIAPLTHWYRRAIEKAKGPVTPIEVAKAALASNVWADLPVREALRAPSGVPPELLSFVRIAGVVAQLALGRHAQDSGEARAKALLDRIVAVDPEEGRKLIERTIAAGWAALEAKGLPPTPAPDSLVYAVTADRPAFLAVADSRRTVKADAAFAVFNTSCRKLRWAIVDSGIDAGHPAFARSAAATQLKPKDCVAASRVVETYELTWLTEILSRGTGPLPERFQRPALAKRLERVRKRTDACLPIDWGLLLPLLRIEPRDYVPPADRHGTHVAGTLAADWPSGPRGPMRGICPDLELVDVRVCKDDGSSTEFVVTAALQLIRYLNAHAEMMVVNGVNMSLSLEHDVANYACGRTPVCLEAERAVGAGIVVVAAAGNRGYRHIRAADESSFYQFCAVSITDPGNAQGVITVGATHRREPHNFGVSYFSSRGPTGDGRIKPDLVAPGEKIYAPAPNGEAVTLDGTSMATPHVSGAAALLMARNPELVGQPERIKRILCDTATDLGRERYFQGHGLLDILRALQSV